MPCTKGSDNAPLTSPFFMMKVCEKSTVRGRGCARDREGCEGRGCAGTGIGVKGEGMQGQG